MTTGATEYIDATTAASFIPELWSLQTIRAREQKLMLSRRADRRYEKDFKYGDTLHVPGISHLTVQTKNLSANAATVYETVTESLTDLTVGTWEYNAIAVETATKRQANQDMLSIYAPEQGYALALAVDDGIATLAAAVTGQSVGSLLSPLTYDNVLRARQYLNDANVPMSDRTIVISPAQETEFMKLDQFVNGDYKSLQGGAGDESMGEAYIGTWVRIPVFTSTNVDGSNAAGHDNILFHKEAFALVLQMNPTSHDMFDIDSFTYKVSIEQLRGNATMRADHACRMRGL